MTELRGGLHAPLVSHSEPSGVTSSPSWSERMRSAVRLATKMRRDSSVTNTPRLRKSRASKPAARRSLGLVAGKVVLLNCDLTLAVFCGSCELVFDKSENSYALGINVFINKIAILRLHTAYV